LLLYVHILKEHNNLDILIAILIVEMFNVATICNININKLEKWLLSFWETVIIVLLLNTKYNKKKKKLKKILMN